MADIKHLVRIKATPSEIFRAVTTKEGLASWWTPDVKAQSAVGSQAIFEFGPSYRKTMWIEALEPPALVQWKCIDAVAEWVGTTVKFEISQNEGESVLTFSHDGWREVTSLFHQCSFDWAMFLKSLKDYLESGQGKPYPNQYT